MNYVKYPVEKRKCKIKEVIEETAEAKQCWQKVHVKQLHSPHYIA